MQRFSLRGEAFSLLAVPTAGCTSTLSEPSLRSSTQLSGNRVNQALRKTPDASTQRLLVDLIA